MLTTKEKKETRMTEMLKWVIGEENLVLKTKRPSMICVTCKKGKKSQKYCSCSVKKW